MLFDAGEITRAGAFVSIAADGHLRVERGYVRPEDELPAEAEPGSVEDSDANGALAASYDGHDTIITAEPATDPDEDEGLSPISDRLMTELTSHRTLGLRQALGERPDIAFVAAMRVLTLKTFYHYGSDTRTGVSTGTRHYGFTRSRKPAFPPALLLSTRRAFADRDLAGDDRGRPRPRRQRHRGAS